MSPRLAWGFRPVWGQSMIQLAAEYFHHLRTSLMLKSLVSHLPYAAHLKSKRI